MLSRATIAAAAVAFGLALPAGMAQAEGRPAAQLAQCTIDAVPARQGRRFGGAFSRREKPPDYLLPKKDDDSGQQSAPSAATGVTAPPLPGQVPHDAREPAARRVGTPPDVA